jgi:Zinc knuckle
MPMELNATATVQKLTPEEREKCMREGLCLRCRAKGHMARECPKTLKQN